MTRWQKFYLEDSHIVSVSSSNFSKKAVDIFNGYHKRKILDLACGVGRDSFYMADQSLNIVGGDLARSGLEIAQQTQKHFPEKSVDFIQVDARCLPFENNTFEGVYCFGLLHEFSHQNGWQDISQIMEEIYRVIEPGGILLLAVLSGDPLLGLPHVLLFSEEMFDRATQSFSMIEKKLVDDIGCTGRIDYHTWQGIFRKNI